MNIFPFTITNADALFIPYVRCYKEDLRERYGASIFINRTSHELHWSWYQVDAEVLSETEVVFITYSMANFSGGRGGEQERISHTYEGKELAHTIEARREQLALRTYIRRRKEEAKRLATEGVAKIYRELFGPADSVLAGNGAAEEPRPERAPLPWILRPSIVADLKGGYGPEIYFDPLSDGQWPEGCWACRLPERDAYFGATPNEALAAWEAQT